MQEESRRASQQHLDQKVNSEAQRSSSLVAQLRAMVADREAKVRQLELEIGQLSVQVSWVPPGQSVSVFHTAPSTLQSRQHWLLCTVWLHVDQLFPELSF